MRQRQWRDGDPAWKDADDEDKPKAAHGSSGKAVCLLVCLMLIFAGAVLRPLLGKYSWRVLLSGYKQLDLTAAEAKAILESHRFVVIGGPHRGGTTLLSRALKAHPLVSGFSDQKLDDDGVGGWMQGVTENADTDFSEGAWLQSVLPTFGIVSAAPAPGAAPSGLGRYAFDETNHYTEQSALATAENSVQLVREWGANWNLSRPVLLEKTPTNMLTSRLLQARAYFSGAPSAFNEPTC